MKTKNIVVNLGRFEKHNRGKKEWAGKKLKDPFLFSKRYEIFFEI
jgi:hypothetical protein